MQKHPKKTGDTILDGQHEVLERVMSRMNHVMLKGDLELVHDTWTQFRDVVEQHFTYENNYLHVLPEAVARQHHREHIHSLQRVRAYTFHDDDDHKLMREIFNEIRLHLTCASENALADEIRKTVKAKAGRPPDLDSPD